MSDLPDIFIDVNKENLGQSLQTEDGIAGLIVTGASVSGKIQVDTPTTVFSLNDAIAKGITETGINSYAYKHVKQYYDEAGNGAELWVMVVSPDTLMSDMLDKTQNYALSLLDKAKGRIRLLAVSRKDTGVADTANGLDKDVDKAVLNAQQLILPYIKRYKEASVIIDGVAYQGDPTELKDYRESNEEFVSVLMVNSDKTANASVGLLLGRLSKDPVQRNPGRIRSGKLPILEGFLTNGKSIDEQEDELNAIHKKGYIVMRSFIGRTGYFFSHALTCTTPKNDLNTIPRVRTIYKARRKAYDIFVDEILEEIPLEPNGKIAPSLIKSWEAKIETILNRDMTERGEISGVSAFIDADQDILGTNQMDMELKIQPLGSADYIKIKLGYTTVI